MSACGKRRRSAVNRAPHSFVRRPVSNGLCRVEVVSFDAVWRDSLAGGTPGAHAPMSWPAIEAAHGVSSVSVSVISVGKTGLSGARFLANRREPWVTLTDSGHGLGVEKDLGPAAVSWAVRCLARLSNSDDRASVTARIGRFLPRLATESHTLRCLFLTGDQWRFHGQL